MMRAIFILLVIVFATVAGLGQEKPAADPLTGAQVPVKARTTMLSADEYVYQQFMNMPGGSEFKSMENRCTRRK